MSEQKLTLRVGNRLPQFSATLLDEFGDPIDLTGLRVWLVIRAIDSPTVFGEASPYVVEATVVAAASGTVRRDWLQVEVDAAIPGRYNVSVRLTDAATGDQVSEVPTRRDATLIVRPAIVGFNYMQDADGELVLTTGGQPIPT
jgi:hypothetical protein